MNKNQQPTLCNCYTIRSRAVDQIRVVTCNPFDGPLVLWVNWPVVDTINP